MRKLSTISISMALIASAGLLIWSCSIIPSRCTLQATDEWLATGFDVETGDFLLILAEGLISINSDLFPNPVTGPNGETSLPIPAVNEPATANTYPLPTALYGALVGRIGSNGEVFFVGEEGTITADTTGELYLTVNDNFMENNTGFFDITIKFAGNPGGMTFF